MTIFEDKVLCESSVKLTHDFIKKAQGSSYIVCMRASLELNRDVFKKFIIQDPTHAKFKRDLIATWFEMLMVTIETEWRERYGKDFYSEDFDDG